MKMTKNNKQHNIYLNIIRGEIWTSNKLRKFIGEN